MIVTFYSFKGGVGRSMAMAACAYLFAQRGLRTLAIDFDLEAPGIERYFFDDRLTLESVRARPGLIDLVLAYKRALTNKAEFERAEFREWRNFVEEAIPATTERGSVHLMTAGRRAPDPYYAEYALAVRSFDWQDFFDNWRGDRFFEWLRRELTDPARGYDVVLVDSRTGVTEMGGVCAYQLADTAVLLCAANYQNLEGTRAIVDDFRSDAVTVLRHGRPIEILVVPARIEDDSDAVSEQRERFFADLQTTFGSDGMPKVLADAAVSYRNIALQYRPELAVIERLVDSEALTRGSFERLTDALTLLAAGPRWDDLKRQSLARLTGESASAPAASVADVTKRGAGYDLLLYFQAADADAARALRETLTARGLNIATPEDAAAGERFPETLRALEYAAALAIVIGRSTPTTEYWQLFREAQLRRKRIVPVLLPGFEDPQADLAQFGVADYQAIDLREGLGGIEALVATAGLPAPNAAEASVQADPDFIYPGALPFVEDQSGSFFGREREAESLLHAFADRSVVVLTGASGVGKTSLVNAGLLPRVRRNDGPFRLDGPQAWHVVFVDASAALEAAAAADEPTLYVVDHVDSFPEIRDAQTWERRRDAVARLIDASGPRARFLVVGRQMLAPAEWQDALGRWGRRHGGVGEVVLEPLAPETLRDAIEKPAARAGHLFEPGLVDRVLADCGTHPGAVAQAQIAAADLWKARRRGWLTNRAYDAAGGISGRYAARLQAFTAGATEFGGAVDAILRALVRLDSLLHVAPQPRTYEELSTIPAIMTPDPAALCERLAAARLIDIWRPAPDQLFCSLSHGVVPGAFKAAIGADAAFMLWRDRLKGYVLDYEATRGATDSLLTGDIKGEAERWFGTHQAHLAAGERALVEASTAAHKRQEKAKRRRAQVKVALWILPAVVALTIAYGVTEVDRRAAEAGRLEAEERYVAANSAAQDLEKRLAESLLRLNDINVDRSAVQAQLAGAESEADRAALRRQLEALDGLYRQAESQAYTTQESLKAAEQNQLVTASTNRSLLTQVTDLQKQLAAASEDRERLRLRAADAEAQAEAARRRAADLEAKLGTRPAGSQRVLPATADRTTTISK